MNIISLLWIALQVIIGYHLVLPFLLFSVNSIRSRGIRKKQRTDEADYAIIVTAYEQTDLIPSVVASILKLNYSNYLVYVVADKCDVSGLNFEDPRVILLRPETALSSNTRSHFYAINRFVRAHDRITIIDSDNLVDPEYLNRLDDLFADRYIAVQGVREAKNLNTHYACLDAARDIYYRFVDNKLLFETGSSATLSGSGMAFTTRLYKDCLEELDIEGAGFDKVLQFEILKRGHRIAFAEQAVVYDEKTSQSDQLVKQRARWLNTWFKYFSLGTTLTLDGIKGLNWNQFLFGIFLMRPPLFILLLFSLLFVVVNLVISPVTALLWVVSLLIFVSVFFIAFAYFKANRLIYKSLFNAPRFIYFQVVALLKARQANQLSVATKHFIPVANAQNGQVKN